MDVPEASWRQFIDLIDGTGNDHHAVGPALTQLVAATRSAVPSYRGMRITAHVEHCPVHLDAFLPADATTQITTSLRLPLALLSSTFVGDGHIVFYATTPGAFVDLAADLHYVLAGPPAARDVEVSAGPQDDHGIQLDRDLPPVTDSSGLTGIEDAAAVGRAVGFLIAAGHLPEHALAELQQRAAATGLTLPAYAARLLGR